MKLVLKILILAVIVCALPFVVEAVIATYQSARDPWIKPGSVVTSGGALKSGMNRRAYNEIRFRSTGMRFRLEASGVSAEMVDTLENKIHGTVSMLQGKDGELITAYNFTLHQTLKKDVSVVETRAATESELAAMDLTRRYDVVYELAPVSHYDRIAADKIKNREFESEEEIEFDFLVEGAAMPQRNTLTFIYSKAPTSILRGTFLENMSNRLRGVRPVGEINATPPLPDDNGEPQTEE